MNLRRDALIPKKVKIGEKTHRADVSANYSFTIGTVTVEQLKLLPGFTGNYLSYFFDGIIILPLDEVHDSGYKCIEIISVENNIPRYKLSSYSDVIHIDGIGGYGYNWAVRYHGVPQSTPPIDWSIDCLPKCKLLHLFCSYKLRYNGALSSFEIYAQQRTTR